MQSLSKLFVFILLFVSSLLCAQNNGQGKSSNGDFAIHKPIVLNDSSSLFKQEHLSHYNYESNYEYSDSATEIENSLSGFQNYLPRTTLGNVGLEINDSFYKQTNNIGFNYGKNVFADYFYTPQNIKFYNTRTPFTDLFYVAGTKKEGDFKMTFSYNIKKNWNVTIDFTRIRSEGIYSRQKTLNNYFAVSSNYKTNNNRYWLLFSTIYNGVKAEENGGIQYDTAIDATVNNDRKLVFVNLASAKRTVNNRTVFLKQYLNFGKHSNDTAMHNAIIPRSRLILTSKFDDYAFRYTDDYPLAGFYSNVNYDSVKTYDTTYFYKLSNELEWKRADDGQRRGLKDMIGFSIGAKNEIVRVKQHSIDTSFQNNIASAFLYNMYSNHQCWWRVGGRYVVTGYNKDDYNISGVIRKDDKYKLFSLTLNAYSKQYSPDFIYSQFQSNNFIWNNKFVQTNETGAGFNVFSKLMQLSIGADYKVFKNVLYFDNFATARQYTGTIPVIDGYAKKNFKVETHNRNSWNTDVVLRYQYVPDSLVIRLPQWVGDAAVYYETNLFKKAMFLQIGASVFYSSAYYANAYMPATGEFYLQSAKQYGNYPYIDVFLNVRIKTVRVFIKVDHLNSGWTGINYMLTPHYPMNDRLFKFGISWRFWD
jgi:hypothetical protein